MLSILNLQISKKYNRDITGDLFLMNIRKNRQYAFFLNEGKTHYANLKSIGFEFDTNIDGDVISVFQNIKVQILTYEELYILNEVFFEGVYNFSFPKKCVIIDIGMNVGFSSLFFANMDNVQNVLSYEPVSYTYNQGLKNIDLNNKIKAKIIPHNFGIGSSTHYESFNYSEEWKGSVGIRELDKFKKDSTKSLELIEVEIKDISNVIADAKSHGLPIVAKIDCEGAEYEIIKRLKDLNDLSSIDLYMMEWHDKGPSEISNIFQKAGYVTIVSRPYVNKEIGMIYACKQ